MHDGGQGFWVARMLATLDMPVTLCGAFGSETGTVIRTLIEQHDITVRAVEAIAEIGEGFLRLGVADEEAHHEPGSDAALVAAGYASVTALRPLCDLHDDGLSAALDRTLQAATSSPSVLGAR